MKTIIKKTIKLAALLLTLSLVVACDNKKSSTTTATGTLNPYVMQNGRCIVAASGQAVDPYLCQNQNYGYTTNIYGQCVQTSTNQVVSSMYCQQNMGGSQQCYGTYWVAQYNQWQQIQCQGMNCSGMTVYPNGATSPAQAIRCL